MSSINASTTSIPNFDPSVIGGTTQASLSAYAAPAPPAATPAPAAHVHDAAAPAATAQAATGAASTAAAAPDLVAALQQLITVLGQLAAVLGAQSGAAALGGGAPGKGAVAGPSVTQAPPTGVSAGGPSTLHGTLQPGNKQVSGAAAVTTGANGQRTLNLSNLKTEHGPDLHVYLAANNPTTDAGVTDYVDLGKLGNENGDSSYAIPAGTDLSKYGTLVIWCDEANTTFGRAPLTAG
ncbi:MAG: Electron transfer [Thermoleophilia bacterium]|nr:Electron transfer [Thermoleophilia bacterium]